MMEPSSFLRWEEFDEVMEEFWKVGPQPVGDMPHCGHIPCVDARRSHSLVRSSEAGWIVQEFIDDVSKFIVFIVQCAEFIAKGS